MRTQELPSVDQSYGVEVMRKGIHLGSLAIPIVYFFIDKNTALLILVPLTAIVGLADFIRLIHEIRGEKVILDSDLARLYGVTAKRLNEQVKRNGEHFPTDFVFQLTAKESAASRSQFATSSRKHRGIVYRPSPTLSRSITRSSSPPKANTPKQMRKTRRIQS